MFLHRLHPLNLLLVPIPTLFHNKKEGVKVEEILGVDQDLTLGLSPFEAEEEELQRGPLPPLLENTSLLQQRSDYPVGACLFRF